MLHPIHNTEIEVGLQFDSADELTVLAVVVKPREKYKQLSQM